jgi:raffinose/stachyose/melibiose transport system permease protein
MTAPLRKRTLVIVVLLIVGVLWMIPEFYLVSISLRTPANAFDSHLFVAPLGFENYGIVISQNPLLKYFFNSTAVTVPTVLIVLLFASLFAFGKVILKLRWGDAVYTVLLTALMVPLTTLVLPLALMLKGFKMINTYSGLIAPYSALGIPFAVVVLNAFLEDSPKELYEAARVDGCGPWQLYWRVSLPLIRPSLVFVGIWQFITTWNEFFLALVVMTDADHRTLPLVPQQYSGLYMANPGALFAVLVIVALPLILLFLAVQKAFVRGLLEGAVKG